MVNWITTIVLTAKISNTKSGFIANQNMADFAEEIGFKS